jgi:hypothetical protein
MRDIVETKRLVELSIPASEVNIFELVDDVTPKEIKAIVDRMPNCILSLKRGKALLVCGRMRGK